MELPFYYERNCFEISYSYHNYQINFFRTEYLIDWRVQVNAISN